MSIKKSEQCQLINPLAQEQKTARILVVEDSRTFGALVVRTLKRTMPVEVDWARSLREARALLTSLSCMYAVAVLDLNLPDAPSGEIVDLVLEHGIPVIAITGERDGDLYDEIWAKDIVDYIIKDSLEIMDYLATLTRRVLLNPEVGVLVVDDSRTSRHLVSKLLASHRYTVHDCASGEKALEVLDTQPGVRMVVTDYNMPGMDGFELTRRIRKRFKRDALAIIGMSSQGHPGVSARFIKNGANDFLSKPFTNEEFYCRVMQNVEMLESFEIIRDIANKDYLTGLHNRRYLFEHGRKAFDASLRGSSPLALAMLDIDFFKQINDTHGHEAGDRVLAAVAGVMRQSFSAAILCARYGGEEFCVLLPGVTTDQARELLEALRGKLAVTCVEHNCRFIGLTVSIGVCCRDHGGQDAPQSFEEMVNLADALLYKAKNNGRDRVELG